MGEDYVNKAIEIEYRIKYMLSLGLTLRRWEMGNTNFQCEVCEREHFPANPIYISAASSVEEIKEDPAATCEIVLGSGCAKKIGALKLIKKL